MNKKEKYYNYVVEDIVKNTEIDYDQETIKFPFFLANSNMCIDPRLFPSHIRTKAIAQSAISEFLM